MLLLIFTKLRVNNAVMYSVEYTKQALNTLRRMPLNTSALMQRKIRQLALDPLAMPNVKKLSDHPGFRMRVGDWRIIYTLENERLIIQVLRIGPRGGIYK